MFNPNDIQKLVVLVWGLGFLIGCDSEEPHSEPIPPTWAEGVSSKQGEIRPNATESERAIFEEGLAVAKRQFTLRDGLGPHFNVTFCGGCHEKPSFGGAAGHYRDFYIYGEQLNGGVFSPSGPRSGVLTTFRSTKNEVSEDQQEMFQDKLSKTDPDEAANLFTLRNPIPFFGIGLLAEIPEEEILAYADPDDIDGDGISGRPNFDQGYVGRFGLKAQTVSIENFIRGPLFNHLGITTNPLSAELQAALPVPSVAEERFDESMMPLVNLGHQQAALTNHSSHSPLLEVHQYHQAAAPSEPLTDTDGVADPELSERDLFALVSWAMLLAAPEADPLDMISERGEGVFHAVGCASCHVPHLNGPRGLISPYSDLLLHDMGSELADGVVMALASGSEFRTQPLWGVSSTGPYLYDGRASTLDEAIALHGGEAKQSRDEYLSLTVDEREALIAFLESLGGQSERSVGLLPPRSPLSVGDDWKIEPIGTFTPETERLFLRGRELFDQDVGFKDGLGPIFNGDSCRGCHFEPAIGGSGPTGVSAVRQLTPLNTEEESRLILEIERDGSLIRRFAVGSQPPAHLNEGFDDMGLPLYEVRQAPPSFGLNILEEIPNEAILSNADPDDLNGDGIRGVARILPNGEVGRFGWRAQLSSIREFTADALNFELGMTLSESLNLNSSISNDSDEINDPELSSEDFEALVFFIRSLAPPKAPAGMFDEYSVTKGEEIFNSVGCGLCHKARLHDNQFQDAYTDLLLHAVQGDQPYRLFRTPPLWGIAVTGTYWHDGRASDLWEAIELHQGEASQIQERAKALNETEKSQLLEFLRSR